MSARRKIDPTTPLFVIAGKQKVGKADADKIALIVLIALDAAKRGAANNALVNLLTQHITTAAALWGGMGNTAMHQAAVDGWQRWATACNRDPDKPLSLTTREYLAVKSAIANYLRALPQVEVGRIARAKADADRFLHKTFSEQ